MRRKQSGGGGADGFIFVTPEAHTLFNKRKDWVMRRKEMEINIYIYIIM